MRRLEIRHVAKPLSDEVLYDLADNEKVVGAQVKAVGTYVHLYAVVEVEDVVPRTKAPAFHPKRRGRKR